MTSVVPPTPSTTFGTTKLAHLEKNIGAAAVRLTPDELREINAAASGINLQGARLDEFAEGQIDR
jgi:aryl-alcohol dehydrogenase-like predicted oxidoreductase